MRFSLRWRRAPDADLTEEERANIRHGIRKDFRLPYPYPRNEHEDGMNMVAVMAEVGRPVMSGRAGLSAVESESEKRRIGTKGYWT